MAEKRRASREALNGHGRLKRQHLQRRPHSYIKQDYGSPNLIGLPTSVQRKIYRYLLNSTESCFYVVHPGKLKSSTGWNEHELAPSLGLFRTCRSINVETSEILYGQTIHFYEHGVLDSWLENIGASNRNRLKHIRCFFSKQCNHIPQVGHVQDVTFYLKVLLRAPHSEIKLRGNCDTEFESWCSERFSGRPRKVSKKKIGSALQSLSKEDFIQECSRLGLIHTLLLNAQGTIAILKYRTADRNIIREQKFGLQGYGRKNKTMKIISTHPVAQVDFCCRKGFFDLPQHLIRRILEQVIGPPRTFEVANIKNDENVTKAENRCNSSHSRTTNLYMALPRSLWTCKRMRDLALRLFYTQNTFSFHYRFDKATVVTHNFDDVLRWLRKTPYRQYAHQVRVDLDFGPHVSLHEIRISLDDFRASSTPTNANMTPMRPLDITCRFITGGAVNSVHMDAVERSITKLQYKNLCMDEDIKLFCDQQEGPCMPNGSYSKKNIREICSRARYPSGCLVDGYGEARSFFVWADRVLCGQTERVMKDYEFPERHAEEPSIHEKQDVKFSNKVIPCWRPWETPRPT